MSLRLKTFIIIGLTFVFLISVLYVTVTQVVMTGYLKLEQQLLKQDLKRVQSNINEEVMTLHAANYDYAKWDDSYEFIQNRNQEYINTNLTGDVMHNYRLDVLAIIDNQGQVFWSSGYDQSNRQFTDLDPEIQQWLKPGNSLITSAGTDQGRGVIRLSKGVLMIVTNPILPTNGQAPPLGVFVMGRWLDKEELTKTSEHIQLDFYIDNDINIKADTDGVQIIPQNDRVVLAKTLLKDVSGADIGSIVLRSNRAIYQQGLITSQYNILFMIVTSLIILMITITLVERLILSRLALFTEEVIEIGTQENPKQRLLVKGKDELAKLGLSINSMLQRLEQAENQQHQEKVSVENRVIERTRELEEKTNQLVIAKAQIEELYRHDQEVRQLKDRFISIASHELRTPLTAIRSYAYMIATKASDLQVRTFVDYLVRSVSRLEHLSEDLTTIAGIENGHLRPLFTKTNLNNLITRVVTDYRRLADEKNLKLIFEASETPIEINVDQRLIQKAVSNLVDNAIKFTKTGQVTIKLERIIESISIKVQDTGMGVPEKMQFMLFEKFSKVAGVGQEFTEGKGLGLYIAKLIVDAHQGAIEYQNVDHGSIFNISLPDNLPDMETKV